MKTERAIAELAARQHGVVTAGQLRAAGFATAAISRRVRAGRLHPLQRGVYLVGHAVAPEYAHEMAAVLACGDGAFASHRSAARIWGLGSFRDRGIGIEVTMSAPNRRRRPGIRIYSLSRPDPRDVTMLHGIPVTSAARTLLDLAAVLPLHDLELAFANAKSRKLVAVRALTELIDRSARKRGVLGLRKLLRLDREHGMTRSEAERVLLRLVRAAGLPLPRVNARVDGREVDFLWREQKVIVEVDGYAFHSGRQSFERDRERNSGLVARGYAVLNVTWRQLVIGREVVVARIAAALAVRSEASVFDESLTTVARTQSRSPRHRTRAPRTPD